MSHLAFGAIVDGVPSIFPLGLRTTSFNGTAVDMASVNADVMQFVSGVVDSGGVYTPNIEFSNDNSTWTSVPTAERVGSLTALSGSAVQQVGYIGTARYIRGVVAASGSPTIGAAYTATMITKRSKQP